MAMSEARTMNHTYVGTEHLLLGLMREGKGIAAQVLSELGVSLEKVREETLKLLGSDPQPRESFRREGLTNTSATVTVSIQFSDGRIDTQRFASAKAAIVYLARLGEQ
jgi:ATP-dependent Clp protease ATP-binding subunit ClpC